MIFVTTLVVTVNGGGDTKCELSKYSSDNNRWAEYMSNIAQARKEYVPCGSSGSCSSCHDGVITKDLEPFKEGINSEMIDQAFSLGRLTKFQIIRGKVYRSRDCMFPFRCQGVEHFLTQVSHLLPDTEFVLNTRDWPVVQIRPGVQTPPLPVFSFSKVQSEHLDIMYPAWAFWAGGPAISLYPTGLGRWDQHRISLGEAAKETPWANKTNTGFFRGSRTSSERDPLVRLSRSCPHVVDAQYTKNQAWKSDKDTLGMEPATEVSLESHCSYRYLFNFRGVAASFRLKHLFLCRSLVLHVGEDWLEFWYPGLVPWYHYIPVLNTATEEEILGLIEFLQENDDLAHQIAEQGADYVDQHLRMEDVKCYWTKLLTAYSKLLKYKIERDPTFSEITS